MKWSNKGHEYDQMYLNISKKNEFYLFGAGDYGRQFVSAFASEVKIAGFIDNAENKQGTDICGYKCYALDEIKLDDEKAIIVTMSQIARTEPVKQLKDVGYKKDEDFFIIEEFISIYNVYKYNRVYFSSISLLPSTICNLNCKYCLNFNPYAKKFYTRDWEELQMDVDLFFKHVDHIMLFHVSGGEPMLYKNTAKLIEYIDANYSDKIDTLRTVTNGTVVPKDEMLEILSKCKVEVTVDDYREAVPQFKDNFDKLISKLEQYKIKYYINKVDSWIDLAPDKTDFSGWSEEKLIEHRDNCSQSWQELRNGKLYSCNYAAYATVAGIAGDEDVEETYDLANHDDSRNKELVEFRLGYTEKGYSNFCKKCMGFTTYNNRVVKVAEQVKRNINSELT
ncbi:MAG: radical SAM protein [Butyrivibrio sp.]|nr:radical SAM protein [Butyrivibrio sp.]